MKRFAMSQKAVSLFCIYSLGFSIFLIIPPQLNAQVELPAEKRDKIQELLNSAKAGSPEQVIDALSKSTRLARPYAKTDSDLDVLLDLFGLESDRLSFFTDEFKRDRAAVDTENSKSALQDLRTKILNQATNLMQMVAKDGITADEARRLLSISKSVSQAVDDLTDQRGFGEKGSFDGAKSSLQKFLTVASGISDLSRGISDRDANRLMSGFRDTIGLIETKLKSMGIATINPLGVFDYPGALAAAQLQVVNEAFGQATESLELISQIIENNNPESRRRLPQLLDSINRTLSPENFGRVLLKAAIDRTVAKFPFARTFQALISPSDAGVPSNAGVLENAWEGVWATNRGDIAIKIDDGIATITPINTGLLSRWEAEISVHSVTQTKIEGYWTLKQLNFEGKFFLELTKRHEFRGKFSEKKNEAPSRSWSGSRWQTSVPRK